MKNIEVEVRSFISKEKYDKLRRFFNSNAELVKEDNQESHYFDTKEDIRIQRNDYFSKIWLKSGKYHDEQRGEIEIKVEKDDFPKLEKLFQTPVTKSKSNGLGKDWNTIGTGLLFVWILQRDMAILSR